ncbi:MAG: CoA ester lyase [Sandaracinus sp.]|nr:CoA ester lyase [Sandaracinus sp.]MCB9635157.1 CoA ester lyase [Sandaracinus sp.]
MTQPRRSVLYMPGSNARALDKGRSLDADGLILDLEDAVAPDAKELAREQVCTATREGGYGHRELFVRVNALDTAWGHADLVAAATSGAHAVLLPKVESADTVRKADQILRANGAPDALTLWCMMETPRGVLRAEEIADSCPRLAGFVMGTSDLAKDLHAAHTAMRLPLLVGLGTCLLAARAAGLAILDGVYLDLEDADGFAESCKQGAELGFDGKTLIHPKQLAAANEAFAPSAAAIEQSRAILAGWEEASKAGKGVVVVNGKLVENLHVENAKRLVALAEAIANR